MFLDDDDLFKNDKLEMILELFSKNDKLGYIHNSFSLIDSEGNNITSNKIINYGNNLIKVLYSLWENKRHLRKITNYCGLVNSSSISIRSSIIDRDTLDYFVNLPGDMDEFLFYELLHSGLDLLMTKDILSFYSIHKEGNSKPKTPSEMVKYIGRIKKSLEMLNKLLENTEFSNMGRWN